MAVPTALQISQLNGMCPVAAALALGTRLQYIDDDGSWNGPITLDTVAVDRITSVSTAAFGAAAGATGVALAGTDPDQVLQAHGYISAAATAGAYAGTYTTLTAVATQTADVSLFGMWAELYLTGAITLKSNHAAVWGNLEMADGGGAITLPGGIGWHAGVIGTVIAPDGLVVSSGGQLAGLMARSHLTAGLTTTGAIVAGVIVNKGASDLAWPVGVYVQDDATTVGVYVGSSTTGIDFGGTYTGNAIDFSNATIDPTGSNGPCMIRCGTYTSPYDYGADNHQSGIIRIYTTCSGDGTSYDRGVFVCTKTTGAKGAFPVSGLAEANNTGTGPAKLQAAQFIAHLGADGSASHLATLGGDATAGMYGAWLKVCAGTGGAVCDSGSRVAAVWLDNQMNGTVSGEEYTIFSTTGCSRPDAWAGFETTSSGYSQLLYFDETFNSGAGICVTTDAVPAGHQDARILVWYDAKQYYIPLYR